VNDRFRIIGAELMPEEDNERVPVKPSVKDGCVTLTPNIFIEHLERVIERQLRPFVAEKQAALDMKGYYEAGGMNREVIHDLQVRMRVTMADGIVGPQTVRRARELGVEIQFPPLGRLAYPDSGAWECVCPFARLQMPDSERCGVCGIQRPSARDPGRWRR